MIRMSWGAVPRGMSAVCIQRGSVSGRWAGTTGSDRMCRLRCFVNNYGRDRIVDLVKYRRERELQRLAATGTDEMTPKSAKKYYSSAQRNIRSYIDCIQASLPVNSTVSKMISIREQISLI